MTTPNEHRQRIRRQDAKMAEAMRDVLSQPDTEAERIGKQQANQLRRIVKQLGRMETELYAKGGAGSGEARQRIYAASNELLVAAHYLEGNV